MSLETYFYLLVAASVIIYILFSGRRVFFSGKYSSIKSKYQSSTLVSVLMNLNERAVAEVLDLYKKEFGTGPARYARRTFKKWRMGEVQPATQTFERFLLHLPKVMSYDLKCEVLRHFMEEYAAKDNYELDVYTDDWEEKLEPLVRRIIDKAFTAQLPAEVENRLRWLGDGDMRAAQEILRASQAQEGQINRNLAAQEEMHNLINNANLLDNQVGDYKISSTFETASGTTNVEIRKSPFSALSLAVIVGIIVLVLVVFLYLLTR